LALRWTGGAPEETHVNPYSSLVPNLKNDKNYDISNRYAGCWKKRQARLIA
jgi:hypothetical protein